jgi:hypothetical protein
MSNAPDKFFSAVPGALVTRYGTGIEIGAERLKDGRVSWDCSIIIAITREEWRRYSREYTNHVQLGELRERTREDFDAYVKAQIDAADAASTKNTASVEPATTTET